MIEVTIREGEEYIKLCQALKKSGLSSSGSEADQAIEEGLVCVNGQKELRRGKKLRGGEIISLKGETLKIIK